MPIEPKPMSAERRAEIEAHIGATSADLYTNDITDLLADAAYWRETVRDADVCGRVGEHCPWCDASDMVSHLPVVHKPDCAWLRAQA